MDQSLIPLYCIMGGGGIVSCCQHLVQYLSNCRDRELRTSRWAIGSHTDNADVATPPSPRHTPPPANKRNIAISQASLATNLSAFC
jgi:hypothetical protein